MRLYDRMIAGDWNFLPQTLAAWSEAEQRSERQWTHDALLTAPRFDITNVADYLYAGTDQEEWVWKEHFPNLAPPFETFWMEFETPRTIRSRDYGVRRTDLSVPRFGYLFSAVITPSDPEFGELAGGWTVLARAYAEVHPYGIVGPEYFWTAILSANGTLVDTPRVLTPFPVPPPEPGKTDASAIFFAPSLAISFLHCANVVVADAPDRRTRQQRRREARKGREPYAFKTLVIEPMRRVLQSEGRAGEVGLPRALHICRGHFSHYGPEFGKGRLFGKYEGQFWIPAHVRGTAEAGMIGKDYAVKAPH